MFRPVFLPLILVSISAAISPAQPVHPALQSEQALLTEITGKTWETSFTNYPRLRFEVAKIEILDDAGKVTGTLSKVSHPEPGIVRVDYNTPGSFALFIFADDLQTFVIANMRDLSTLVVEGGTPATRLPLSSAEAPLSVTFPDNPFWKAARLHANKMEILDGSGAVFATNPAFAYSTRVQGVALPEKQSGALILSRQKPGTGWYVSGRNLGTGVRTEKYGRFRPFLRSHLTDFHLRSAHFGYPLLIAGQEQAAAGQESFALGLVGNAFGDNSDKVARCLNEMGTLRRYARSYAQAAVLHARALEHARTSLSSDKAVLLEFATDLATSQNDAGDFAAAKKTLAEAFPLLPAPGGNISPTYLFYEALGTAEFGLRGHAAAAQHFSDNARRAGDAKLNGSVVDSLLQLIPCQLAQNQTMQAEAALKQAMEVQKQRQNDNSGRRFDTWKLAFACVALGKNTEALQWARLHTQRRNWVSYEELGHLVSLFHGGDRVAAQSLAKDFMARFNNIQEDITVRDDIDPITAKLTLAIAEPTPGNIGALEQLWSAQVDSLRNRPMKNYLFARVMVLTLAKLKSGK